MCNDLWGEDVHSWVCVTVMLGKNITIFKFFCKFIMARLPIHILYSYVL